MWSICQASSVKRDKREWWRWKPSRLRGVSSKGGGGWPFSMTPRYCRHWKVLVLAVCVVDQFVYIFYDVTGIKSSSYRLSYQVLHLKKKKKTLVVAAGQRNSWKANAAASLFVSKRSSWHVCICPSHRAAKWLNGYFILFITHFFQH